MKQAYMWRVFPFIYCKLVGAPNGPLSRHLKVLKMKNCTLGRLGLFILKGSHMHTCLFISE